MLEIYNDTLKDLLAKTVEAALDIRVQGKSVFVPGLTKIPVQTETDILVAMETGEGNRRVASTRMNTQRCSSSNLLYRFIEKKIALNLLPLQFPLPPAGGAGGGGLGPGDGPDHAGHAQPVRPGRLRADLQDRGRGPAAGGGRGHQQVPDGTGTGTQPGLTQWRPQQDVSLMLELQVCVVPASCCRCSAL